MPLQRGIRNPDLFLSRPDTRQTSDETDIVNTIENLTASQIAFSPYGSLSSITVQTALEELDSSLSSATIPYSSVTTVTTARLLGRTTAGTGAAELISIGSGLSLSAGTLSATGGGITIGNAVSGGGANRVLYEDGSQNLAASANLIYDGSNFAVGATTAAARIDASIAGGGSGSNIALGLRAGNDGTYYGNNQITFGYNATAEYRHAIKSRHNGGGATNNALDFYIWKQGTDSSTTVGTQRVLTLDGANGVQAADRFSFVNMPTDYFTGFSDGVGNGFQFTMTNGGQFLPLEYSVAGTNDIFFQLKPATSSGYGYIEAFGSAGLILGTGNNANPVIIRVNRTETARFTANGGFSLKYDASNRMDVTIGSTGGVTFDAVGSGAGFTFSDPISFPLGGAISGGGANRVLYEDGSQNLAASANFTFDGTHTFGLPNSHAMRFPNNTSIFIGNQTGDSWVAGSSNIGIGFAALSGALNSGNQNVGIGTQAGHQITSGSNNVCLGVNAGYSLTTQSSNMFIGYQCGLYNAGNNNVAIGVSALQSSGSGTGSENIGIGGNSLLSVDGGTSNVGIGYVALQSVTSGNQNVAIGRQAGFSVVSGSANVFLGYQAGYNETGSNKLYIANSTTSTPLIYGEFDNKVLYFTGQEIRQRYDASNYFSTTVSSTGGVTFDAVGSGAGFTFSDDVTLADAKNIILNATTGTKIGTATSQKLGFFNATPVVQRTDSGALTDSTGATPGGTISAVSATYDEAEHNANYASLTAKINALRTALRDLGLMA